MPVIAEVGDAGTARAPAGLLSGTVAVLQRLALCCPRGRIRAISK